MIYFDFVVTFLHVCLTYVFGAFSSAEKIACNRISEIVYFYQLILFQQKGINCDCGANDGYIEQVSYLRCPKISHNLQYKIL